jgi:hypothetical protein
VFDLIIDLLKFAGRYFCIGSLGGCSSFEKGVARPAATN